MVDIKSFSLSLPSFIERSYFISPGVVSVIFKVLWSFFTFLVVTLLIEYGLAAVGSKTETKQKSLWSFHSDYNQVQSIANGRWGGMLLNLPSLRVTLGFLFWISIYAFELLFSLSIDNAYITHYNGTSCVGRIDNVTAMSSTMWYKGATLTSYAPPQNSTLLRQLLNQKRVGNIALFGDGIFGVSPADGIYKKDQAINVARIGFNCNSTTYLQRSAHGTIYSEPTPGIMEMYNISTPHYANISGYEIGELVTGYVTLRTIDKHSLIRTGGNSSEIYLVLLSNPRSLLPDMNGIVYNSTVFLSECTLFYEYGSVTIIQEGHLNETNIAGSYKKVDNETVDTKYGDADVFHFLYGNPYFLSTFDFPDIFLNTEYNKTYPETLKIINNMIAAHVLSGLDPYADVCTFNQESVPIYFYVLGTRMSFGYIIIGVVFAVAVLLLLAAYAFTMFTKEERTQWLLYSKDSRFAGYISTGDNMNENTFKMNAKNIYINNEEIEERFINDKKL
ncbi:hypothetical protein K501DRAFT_279455 [Backusella circina FSU 941]|nr:hypothetical protein K501DRAFT_279455 [Backusella circina FSU 941]